MDRTRSPSPTDRGIAPEGLHVAHGLRAAVGCLSLALGTWITMETRTLVAGADG